MKRQAYALIGAALDYDATEFLLAQGAPLSEAYALALGNLPYIDVPGEPDADDAATKTTIHPKVKP